jgi:uncharacterized protein YfaQ (DUF2300 family)
MYACPCHVPPPTSLVPSRPESRTARPCAVYECEVVRAGERQGPHLSEAWERRTGERQGPCADEARERRAGRRGRALGEGKPYRFIDFAV